MDLAIAHGCKEAAMGLLDFMPDFGRSKAPNGGYGQVDSTPSLLSNPMLQMGLGILGSNRGNYGSFGAAVGQGASQGLQNIQRQKILDMQNKMQQRQLDEYDRKLKEQQNAKDAMSRILKGQQGYMTEQETPTQSVQNVPITAQEGAQAPNFGTQAQVVNGVNKTSQFDNARYMQDLIDAGYGDELIKRQFIQPQSEYALSDGVLYDKKTGKYQNIGGQDKSLDTSDIKGYQFARSPEGGGFKGSFQEYLQIKPSIMAGIAGGQLAVSQGKLANDIREANYNLPSQNKTTANYSVSVGGKTYSFPDQKSLNNFKIKAGVR